MTNPRRLVLMNQKITFYGFRKLEFLKFKIKGLHKSKHTLVR